MNYFYLFVIAITRKGRFDILGHILFCNISSEGYVNFLRTVISLSLFYHGGVSRTHAYVFSHIYRNSPHVFPNQIYLRSSYFYSLCFILYKIFFTHCTYICLDTLLFFFMISKMLFFTMRVYEWDLLFNVKNNKFKDNYHKKELHTVTSLVT